MAHVKSREMEKSGSQRKTIAKKSPNGEVATRRGPVDVRAEVERDLAVLRAPDASKKLRAAFGATPTELAAAANAAAAHHKR